MTTPPPEPAAREGTEAVAENHRAVGRGRAALRQDLVRYLPSQILPALIGFFSIPILTRLFGPADYGDYRLVLATVGAFGSAGVWMASAIYRFYPEMEREGRLEEFLATLRGLFVLSALFFAALWLGGLWLARPLLTGVQFPLFLIGLFLMLVNNLWAVASAQVRAVREVTWYSISVVLNKALTLGLGVALVLLFGLSVDGLLLGSIAASVLLLFILFRVLSHRVPRMGSFNRDLGRQMLRFGFPIALMMAANWMLQLSDRFVIAALRGSGEVGLYSAAYGIAEQATHTILVMFQLPFAVLGSRVWERDGEKAAAGFVSDSARSYLLLAIPAWAGISVLAGPTMGVMTPPGYHSASVIMPAVAAALVLGGIHWWYTSGSTFHKRTGQQAVSIVAAVVVNLGLNLALVGRFGYQVAALTTLVAYAVAMVMMILVSRPYFKWVFPMRSLLRALAASTVMAAFIVVLMRATDLSAPWILATSIPLGAVVYGVALAASGEPMARRILGRVVGR